MQHDLIIVLKKIISIGASADDIAILCSNLI